MAHADNWREEKQAAYLYRVMAAVEADQAAKKLFYELAEAADRQAAIWQKSAEAAGETLPSQYVPDMRTLLVTRLVRVFGPEAMRRILSAMKVRGMSIYSHALSGHPMPASLKDVGRQHRGVGSQGNMRAAVFGVNDGLVSNTSLMLGVAGAATDGHFIVISGVAGLLAGAFSMAAGEYLSVRSQREMFEYQIGLEREELEQYPQEEAAELALIYRAKGLRREQAEELARTIIADPARALDTLAREELGLNPNELGSPLGASLFSFVSFAIGASVPVVPFLLLPNTQALPVALALAVVALFGIGAALSLFSGKSAWAGGARMLLIGASAGCATFLIGKVLGVSLN